MLTQKKNIQFITILRGIACIVIVLFHLLNFYVIKEPLSSTWPFFPTFTISDKRLIQPYINDFLDSINYSGGGFGVAIFFLITGFTTYMSLEKDSSYRYMIRRIVRIYPTYIICFSITLLSIYFFSIYQNTTFPYSAKDIVCHMTLFRNWLWSPYIDNGVWTLEMNMDFYIIFFIVYRLAKNKDQKFINDTAIILCVIQIVLFIVVTKFTVAGSFIWCKLNVATSVCPYIVFQLIGASFYNHFNNKITTTKLVQSIMMLLGIFLLVSYFDFDYSMSVSSYIYALLLFVAFYIERDNMFKSRLIEYISSISYPLYILHGLLGFMLLTIMNQHDINPYIALLIAISIVIFISYFMHITVEAWCSKLCKKIVALPKNDVNTANK